VYVQFRWHRILKTPISRAYAGGVIASNHLPVGIRKAMDRGSDRMNWIDEASLAMTAIGLVIAAASLYFQIIK
jgi:hypothetical protein